MSGQIPRRALIAGVSLSSRCEVTTAEDHEYVTGNQVRITDLDGMMPVKRGMDQINNGLFLVEVTSSGSFYIKDPITGNYIDSTNFTPYVTGGRVNLDNRQFIYYGDE